MLDKILGSDKKGEIEQIEKRIFRGVEIKTFHGNESIEIKLIKSFEETCVYLSKFLARNPKELTVLEFYQALEVALEQNDKHKNGKPNSFK